MSRRSKPALVAHADWSIDSKKRWMATGISEKGSYHLSAPEPVGDVSSLLTRLTCRARGGQVLIGFDFPIGLPLLFAKGAQISSFLDLLPQLGSGDWVRFYDIAVSSDDISFHRPFYPYRPGGTRQSHLTQALGASKIRELLRVCERASKDLNDASPLFWTLGAKQVGRGAIAGWRDMLSPALKTSRFDVAVWPFDGPLYELLQNRQCIIAETYPAAACVHLGMTSPGRGWSKKRQSDRKRQGHCLFEWAESRGVPMEDTLKEQVRTGFDGGDDPFDATVGLMSMIEVVLGHRSDGAPPPGPIREVEGWIFGQEKEPHG